MTKNSSGQRAGETETSDEGSDDVSVEADEFEFDAPFDSDDGGGIEARSLEDQDGSSEGFFDGQSDVVTSAGEPFMWAMGGAALYAASFVFAALGLYFVSPRQAGLYIDFLGEIIHFLPLPIVAFVAGGMALESYRTGRNGGLPETLLPITLLIPLPLHLIMFFVEGILTGGQQVTIADLLVANPGLTQLVIWPPVIMGAIFVAIAYQTSVTKRRRRPDIATDAGIRSS